MVEDVEALEASIEGGEEEVPAGTHSEGKPESGSFEEACLWGEEVLRHHLEEEYQSNEEYKLEPPSGPAGHFGRSFTLRFTNQKEPEVAVEDGLLPEIFIVKVFNIDKDKVDRLREIWDRVSISNELRPLYYDQKIHGYWRSSGGDISNLSPKNSPNVQNDDGCGVLITFGKNCLVDVEDKDVLRGCCPSGTTWFQGTDGCTYLGSVLLNEPDSFPGESIEMARSFRPTDSPIMKVIQLTKEEVGTYFHQFEWLLPYEDDDDEVNPAKHHDDCPFWRDFSTPDFWADSKDTDISAFRGEREQWSKLVEAVDSAIVRYEKDNRVCQIAVRHSWGDAHSRNILVSVGIVDPIRIDFKPVDWGSVHLWDENGLVGVRKSPPFQNGDGETPVPTPLLSSISKQHFCASGNHLSAHRADPWRDYSHTLVSAIQGVLEAENAGIAQFTERNEMRKSLMGEYGTTGFENGLLSEIIEWVVRRENYDDGLQEVLEEIVDVKPLSQSLAMFLTLRLFREKVDELLQNLTKPVDLEKNSLRRRFELWTVDRLVRYVSFSPFNQGTGVRHWTVHLSRCIIEQGIWPWPPDDGGEGGDGFVDVVIREIETRLREIRHRAATEPRGEIIETQVSSNDAPIKQEHSQTLGSPPPGDITTRSQIEEEGDDNGRRFGYFVGANNVQGLLKAFKQLGLSPPEDRIISFDGNKQVQIITLLNRSMSAHEEE